MPIHPFHRAVGALVIPENFPKSSGGLKILKDRACDEEGRRISLYNRDEKPRARYDDVDILITIDRKAKAIIEIEESNVKPIQIFGKFFASVFSNFYLDKEGRKKQYSPIADHVLFIQALDSSKLKAASKKTAQWNQINESIQSVLETFFKGKWQYRLFIGTQLGPIVNITDGKGIVVTIQDFLEQNP